MQQSGPEDFQAFIHMNVRIYSPSLGRMLSPDPITQAPENGQNYNRYTYVFNNPLTYTDPSGYVGAVRCMEKHRCSPWVGGSRGFQNPSSTIWVNRNSGSGGHAGPEAVGELGGIGLVQTEDGWVPASQYSPPGQTTTWDSEGVYTTLTPDSMWSTLVGLGTPDGSSSPSSQGGDSLGFSGEPRNNSPVVAGGVTVDAFVIAGGGVDARIYYDYETGEFGFFGDLHFGAGKGLSAGITFQLTDDPKNLEGAFTEAEVSPSGLLEVNQTTTVVTSVNINIGDPGPSGHVSKGTGWKRCIVCVNDGRDIK